MKQFIQPSFLYCSNIYEVNVRQFTKEGNFKAFMEHLPRLKAMGVEILWFMPVHPIGIINRKGSLGSYYSIKDFTDVNPEFGTKQDFQNLVFAIHESGMKIILDWVANHASWDNKWTLTDPDFFVRNEEGNFLAPYDWTDVIQIKHDNPDEQTAMIASMEYWVNEFDIDGFRADLAHLTPLLFWKKAREQLDTLKPGMIWLAETENPEYHEAFDISYTWKWMHESEDQLKKNKDINFLKTVLTDNSLVFNNALRMYFTSNHDENSWNGTEYEKYGLYVHALTVLSCTYIHAIPLIYSGQEIPNQKRLAFFEKDHINWDENLSNYYFYQTLFEYRKREPVFKTGKEGFSFLENDFPVMAYQRTFRNNCMIVILNLSSGRMDIPLFPIMIKGTFKNIFSLEILEIEKNIQVQLEPGGFIVLEKILK